MIEQPAEPAPVPISDPATVSTLPETTTQGERQDDAEVAEVQSASTPDDRRTEMAKKHVAESQPQLESTD